MMRVGILTYHRARNYGAYLQAYGLCLRLNEEPDISAEIIDFHMKKEQYLYYKASLKHRAKLIIKKGFSAYRFEENQKKAFSAALDEMPKSKEYCVSDDIQDFIDFVKGKYDVIISGSDEIWKLDSFRGFPTPYWLPGNLNARKVSYAASSRSDFGILDASQRSMVQNLLNDYSYISVRDEKTKEQIEHLTYNNVNIMPDPSLIYDYPVNKARGKAIIERYCKTKKPVALVMTENVHLAKWIKKTLFDQYELISVFHYNRGYINISELSPLDWMNLIASVDLVLTSYFHATCFALINDVRFLSFGTKIKSRKLQELLEVSGNTERYIEICDEFSDKLVLEALKNMTPYKSEMFICDCKRQFDFFLNAIRNT